MTMATYTDYDTPRVLDTDEAPEDSLKGLKARANEADAAVLDVEESDAAESFELPGADLSGEVNADVENLVRVREYRRN